MLITENNIFYRLCYLVITFVKTSGINYFLLLEVKKKIIYAQFKGCGVQFNFMLITCVENKIFHRIILVICFLLSFLIKTSVTNIFNMSRIIFSGNTGKLQIHSV